MSAGLDRLLGGRTARSAAVAPIRSSDLGRGARLLVPNGAAFGTPQIWRDGVAWDWVRQRPDAYWLEGDRGSSHGGADLGFFVRAGLVYPLPAGLPVRAIADGVIEKAGRAADPEAGSSGVVIAHGQGGRLRAYSHLTDFKVRVKRGARVRAGDVLGETVPYARRWPIVVLHFGIGVLVPGAAPNALDPTWLLRRWRVRHPVEPGSTCDAAVLNRGRPGRWRAPGRIDGLVAVATWARAWRDRW